MYAVKNEEKSRLKPATGGKIMKGPVSVCLFIQCINYMINQNIKNVLVGNIQKGLTTKLYTRINRYVKGVNRKKHRKFP